MRWKSSFIVTALLMLGAVGISFAAGIEGEDAKNELKKFQGTWVMVSGEQDAKKVADEHVSKSKITFEGDKGVLVVPNQSAETIVFEIIKLDPTKNPKEMHIIRKNGPFAGKPSVGIYEFDGNDQYRFAFDPSGTVTLKEFVTKEGTGHIRNSWKRVKP